MTIISELKKIKFLPWCISGLLGVIGFLIGKLTHFLYPVFVQELLNKISNIALLIIILILFLSLIVMSFVYLHLLLEKEKPLGDKYRFDEKTGIRYHNKTGKPYCNQCLVKENRESPLIVFDSNSLICPICNDERVLDRHK